MVKKPLVLCILDGFGYSEKKEFNAVKTAETPVIDRLCEKYPSTLLHASGLHVGLPEKQMGNSEVGHTAIGLGRVVFQDLPRISMAIGNNTLNDIEILKNLIEMLKSNGKTCHLWGLFSDGGIHSHKEHLFAIIDILLSNDIKVCVHACLDGRDTPPKSALNYITEFEEKFGEKAKVATVGGRYFAMDRDKRWDRIEKAYHVMVRPTKFCDSAAKYVEDCYKNNISDEFIPPMAIDGYAGIQKGDAFIAFNFRSDRVRQMLAALTEENFSNFNRHKLVPKFSCIIGMTEYSTDFAGKIGAMFKRQENANSFGEVVSKAGLTQVRAAETEKYPHVTFFFSGGREEAFENEERILIESPKIATYDLQPEMSAKKLTDIIVDNLNNDSFDVYIMNLANPDMVGHTGNFKAVVKAIEVVDNCLCNIQSAVERKYGHLIVTADHGNAEEMFDNESNQIHTAHTANDVLFILASNDYKDTKLAPNGGLKDIAPTILDILNIAKPIEMTGNSLIL